MSSLCLYTSIPIHFPVGCLHPVAFKCHIWSSPICSQSPVLGVSLCSKSFQPRSPFLGRGLAVSCQQRGELFRQLELWPQFWDGVHCRWLYPSLISVSCNFWEALIF